MKLRWCFIVAVACLAGPVSAEQQVDHYQIPVFIGQGTSLAKVDTVVVTLNLDIDSTGTPGNIIVIGIDHPAYNELGTLALRSALAWRFLPGQLNGQPIGWNIGIRMIYFIVAQPVFMGITQDTPRTPVRR